MPLLHYREVVINLAGKEEKVKKKNIVKDGIGGGEERQDTFQNSSSHSLNSTRGSSQKEKKIPATQLNFQPHVSTFPPKNRNKRKKNV